MSVKAARKNESRVGTVKTFTAPSILNDGAKERCTYTTAHDAAAVAKATAAMGRDVRRINAH